MKSLKNLCEGLLSSDFDDHLDASILGELDEFINILKSTRLKHKTSDLYISGDEKLCDTSEELVYSKKFKKIDPVDAKNMVRNHEPGTVLVVVRSGEISHGWNLIDSATGKYVHIDCEIKPKHQIEIYLETIKREQEYRACVGRLFLPHYILPAGTYDYFINAIKK